MGPFDSSAYAEATWLFLRLFGAVALIAFVSLLVQMRGLFGSAGVSPIGEHVRELRRQGASRRRLPSLFWLGSSDTMLVGVALLGAAAALLVTLDVATVPAIVVVWVSYLSFTTLGREFLAYQWDVMLVEVAVIALLLAVQSPPHPVALLLAWFFAFRFMFTSGAAKLTSGDQTWRGRTALHYHFETQPLPTRLAWHAHRAPRPLLRAATVFVLAVEIGVPFLLFGPEPVRLFAVAVLAMLQVAILLTGNYGFFNLLALVILVPFVPDRVITGALGAIGPGATSPTWPATPWLVAAGAVVLLLLNVARLVESLTSTRGLVRILRAVRPWRLANRYGLFAVMTTTRPEITIEGSHDGRTWEAYEFRWKPGDQRRRPRRCAPHQPRLDWQLWFAALGSMRANPWFLALLERLLAGSPAVTALLRHDPFAVDPPRYVRARLDDYRFSDRATRRQTGRWWLSEPLGVYAPVATLHDDRIRFV